MWKSIFVAAAVTATFGITAPVAQALPLGQIIIYVNGQPQIFAQCASSSIDNPPVPITEVDNQCSSFQVILDIGNGLFDCVKPLTDVMIPPTDQNPVDIGIEAAGFCPG